MSARSHGVEPMTPGPDQESVWDYPRPPRVEATTAELRVVLGGRVIASTRRALRVLETSHPPTYYLPRDSFEDGSLVEAEGSSYCEFKGEAAYLDVVGGQVVAPQAGWHYPEPLSGYAQLADHVAVYPQLMDRCTVDGEVVRAQPGRFYGGWVTANVVGPFKGVPGSMGW